VFTRSQQEKGKVCANPAEERKILEIKRFERMIEKNERSLRKVFPKAG